MELLERYLQAVKFWLPRKSKEDIIAELSEDIRSQIEEQETALGRKLNQAEVETLLKQRGSPLMVASRYQPQQSLIGPALFPIYSFVLKLLALVYLVPWIVVWICLMWFSPSYRAHHSGWINGMLSAWASLWTVVIFAVGGVTIVFAVLERTKFKARILEKWDPRKLPPVRDPNKIPRLESVAQIVANLMFVIWWSSMMASPNILDRIEVKISLAPVWPYFFWGFLLLALAVIPLATANLLRPYWTRTRASLRLALDLMSAALFCWMLKAHILAQISVANLPVQQAAKITNAINLWAARSFPIAVALGLIIAGADIYRIARVGRKGPGLKQQAAAMLAGLLTMN